VLSQKEGNGEDFWGRYGVGFTLSARSCLQWFKFRCLNPNNTALSYH